MIKHPPSVRGSFYLHSAVTRVGELVKNAKKDLKGVKFDVIACAGVSGMLVAPVLAFSMRKRIIVVRKDITGTHSSFIIEGNIATCDRVLLVDDFVDTGKTRDRMIKHLHGKKEWALDIIGTYEYSERRFTTDLKRLSK